MKSRLPKIIRDVATVIGTKGAKKLMETYGGVRIFIPKKMSNQHKLAVMLGPNLAKKMSMHFGGESIQVPKGAAVTRGIRNHEIVNLYGKGTRVCDLAMDFALTERQIYTILKKTAT